MFVLPNNKNIIMAAQQCVGLTEKQVIVVPTATVPQGISAMMAVDPDNDDPQAILAAMTEAAANVTTAQITYAARNSDFDGFAINEGDYLALCGRQAPRHRPPIRTPSSSPFTPARVSPRMTPPAPPRCSRRSAPTLRSPPFPAASRRTTTSSPSNNIQGSTRPGASFFLPLHPVSLPPEGAPP